jgi:hypothetical protein
MWKDGFMCTRLPLSGKRVSKGAKLHGINADLIAIPKSDVGGRTILLEVGGPGKGLGSAFKGLNENGCDTLNIVVRFLGRKRVWTHQVPKYCHHRNLQEILDCCHQNGEK